MRPLHFNRYHIPAVILILAGMGLLVAGGQYFLVEERTYSVIESELDDGPGSDQAPEHAHDFSTLPSNDQEIFLEAVESSDGTTTVTGQWNFAEELLLDPASGGFPDSYTFVLYEDTLYEVSIQRDGGHWNFGPLLFLGIVIPSVLFLVGVGAFGLATPRPLFPTAVVVGLLYPSGNYALNELGFRSAELAGLTTVIVSVSILLTTYGVLHWKHPLRGRSGGSDPDTNETEP